MLWALRLLLVLDAAVLLLLGAVLLLLPGPVTLLFGFQNLPPGVDYILGLWGCVVLTCGVGYVAAAQDPIRHLIWIQIAIARGALQCVFGLVCLARGIVEWRQAAFGILASAIIACAFAVLYPRPEKLPSAARAGQDSG
jgi:hypothetical protein